MGSSSTAAAVSERLKLPMNNFTFRDLAQERGVTFERIQEQAKHDPSIDLQLDRRLITWANSQKDCLVATDLACWLDDPKVYTKLGLKEGIAYNLKIWLEAPLEERARRMQEREGGEINEIKRYNHQRDLDNRERYLALYGVDIADHSKIDWILETSHLPLQKVVDLICQRIEQQRYDKSRSN